MDPHAAQVIFQVLMARVPEFLGLVSQEIAHVLHQDRIAKIGYQQALQQASVLFVESLCVDNLTQDAVFKPIIISLPMDETDIIPMNTFSFSKRHFATNVHRYAADVERFYRQKYAEFGVDRVSTMVTDAGITITLSKDE